MANNNYLLKILLLASVFPVSSQMLIGNNYAEAATIKSNILKDAGHITCKDGKKYKIDEFYTDAKTNAQKKLSGEFGLGQASQGDDMKINEGTFTGNNYEFKSTTKDWSVGCSDTFGIKGTLKESCGDAASIKYESTVGTTYDVKGKVTCTK
jgi:hypothetical protein